VTLFLLDFLVVSTPILGAGLLLTHLQRNAIARGRILRWAVFASLASPLVRLFVPPSASRSAIVVDRIPVDMIGVIWLAVALAILSVLLIATSGFEGRTTKRCPPPSWSAEMDASPSSAILWKSMMC
jgi:hypothetical protein